VLPDVLIALQDLDAHTPSFFVDEMWARSDLRSVYVARAIISSLDARPEMIRLLRKRLAITRYSDGDDSGA
jgi:hypothetical protein